MKMTREEALRSLIGRIAAVFVVVLGAGLLFTFLGLAAALTLAAAAARAPVPAVDDEVEQRDLNDYDVILGLTEVA